MGTTAVRELQYTVLSDGRAPYLLACLRWPDVAVGLSAGRPAWREDEGLFDLPYAPNAAAVTSGEAAAIAARWGAGLPDGPDRAGVTSAIFRRMPPNWADMAPVERRAWSLGRSGARGRKAATMSVAAAPDRRRHDRVRIAGTATIDCAGERVAAEIVDVSLGGVCCLVTDDRVELERLGRVEPLVLERHGTSGAVVATTAGTVSWHEANGKGRHLGIAFGALDGEQRDEVERFLTGA